MLGCLVMVSSATAKAVFEEWGGLRSGAFAGHPASHRQAVRVEEEIVDAHREDAVFVADGFDHVAYEDDLLEAVVDLEQRGLLLRDLLRCGQLVCGLNVAAPVAEVRHEIDLEAFAVRHTFAGAAPVDHAHIDVVAACSQLVVHDVLHDVRLLDLAEPQSRVAQPHVLEIVFLRAADVLASLDVEPSRLLDDERVLEMADVLHDGVRADAGMQHAGERGLDLGRIGQGSDGGGQHVDQVVELLRPAQPVARDDVLEIGLLEQVLQIEGLLLVASHGQGERHAAEHHVFGPAVLDVAVVRLHELGERQGADADLVAAAAELGHHVGGQHLRVAASHVHVHVAHAQQPVEHPVQTGRLLAAHLLVRDRVLHLVQQHVVRFLAIRDTGSHIVGQGVRVGVRGGCRFVRGGIVCRLLSAVV